MNKLIETVSYAVLNYIKEPFAAVISVFVLLTVITVILVIREIRKQNDT